MSSQAGDTTKTLTLPDGRTLAWCEYGNPAGTPLMFFHGLPGSRRMAFPAWASSSLRVIVPDRPGFGLSTFQAGRTLLDWPGDVRAIADNLDIESYLVAGISGGGPHALVCACRPLGRVTGCAVLSGSAPMTPEAVRAMHGGNRMVFTLARRAPFLLHLVMGLQARAARGTPNHARAVKAAAKVLPPADAALMADAELFKMFQETSAEAARNGAKGIVHEARMLAEPWGFEPSEAAVPVHLWQGGEDRNVPEVMGRTLAAAIPGCVPHFEPPEGHLFTINRWPEIEEALLSLKVPG